MEEWSRCLKVFLSIIAFIMMQAVGRAARSNQTGGYWVFLCQLKSVFVSSPALLCSADWATDTNQINAIFLVCLFVFIPAVLRFQLELNMFCSHPCRIGYKPFIPL